MGRIREEHEATVEAVLLIVEADELLDRQPVLQRSIQLRNPYVDPMNAIQVELLRRYREAATRPSASACAGRSCARSPASPRRCATRAERGPQATFPRRCPAPRASHRSTAAAHRRPSVTAQTISDWPRRASPAAKTPSALVR